MNHLQTRGRRGRVLTRAFATIIATSTIAFATLPAHADDTGSGPLAINIPSGLLGTGSDMFPDYDINNWLLFEVMVPTGARYVVSGNLVSTIDAWVDDPANLGVALPPKSSTGVVYVLDVPTGELDDDIEVTFPNPEGLIAGDVHLVYAYDHANGVWVVVGTAEVSADESVLTTMANSTDNLLGYHFVDAKVLYNTGGGGH